MSGMLPTEGEGPVAPAAPTPAILTTPPDVPREETAFVQHLVENVNHAKKHFEADFNRIRRDMNFAAGLQHADQDSYDDERYRVNITLRHIRVRTAQLYAKNPKALYRRKRRLDFAVWDETPESLMMAQGAMQQAMAATMPAPPPDPMTGVAMPPPPMPDDATLMQAQAILADHQKGMMHRAQMERVGKTLEILWDYFIDEPTPNTKMQMKAMVRRAITCGVGYTKLRYQGLMQLSPDSGASIADLTQQLAAIERLRARVLNPDAYAEIDHEAERLRQALMSLQETEQVMAREGPMLDFPRTLAIIPDPNTRSLRGWVGTGWIAEEFVLPAEAVQELYSVDLKAMAAQATRDGHQPRVTMRENCPHIRLWQVHHKETRRLYTVADGWPAFLEKPRAPDVDVEQFFPYYALTLNDIEHDKRIYPPSDVELIRPVQQEYNRTGESKRQHRIASRPLYVSPNGAFDKEDKRSLAGYEAHDVIVLNGLKEGQNVGELLQPVLKVPMDPMVYETETLFMDVQRVTGSQAANLGGTTGDSATEVSVAEASRVGAVGSDTDEIDETLNDIARDFGQVCLARLPVQTVQAIAGPGAVWPDFSRGEIMAEVSLSVEAGSSGRPNRDRDLANLERAMPYILQIPGVKPEKLARYALQVLDDRLDVNDWIDAALPSITSLNRGPASGPGGSAAPDQQGAAGADNAPSTQARPPGAQPAYGPSGNNVG
jgi:hypothetical protein